MASFCWHSMLHCSASTLFTSDYIFGVMRSVSVKPHRQMCFISEPSWPVSLFFFPARVSFSVLISHNSSDGGCCMLRLYCLLQRFELCLRFSLLGVVSLWSCCFESFGPSEEKEFCGSKSIIWSCFGWFQTACPRLCPLVFLVWL